MTYRVEFAESAIADADEIFRYIEARAPLAARRWKTRLHRAIDGLSTMPNRCPLAPESRHFDQPVRQKRLGDTGFCSSFVAESSMSWMFATEHAGL